MTRTPFLLMLAAAAALAGCNKQGHTIVAGPEIDDNQGNVAANGPVTLPPSILATKIYRCADNALVTVDYLSDNKSANVHGEKGAPIVQVVAPEAGQPMIGPGGYEVAGSANSSTAKIAVPGHPSQSCKA
jgi:uncharacterized lipoprotein YajG